MKTLKQHSFSMRECDHDVELLGDESERFRCSNTISVRCAPRACSQNLRLTLCFEEVGALSIVKQTRLVFEERCLATSSYQSMVRQFASERCDRRNRVGTIIRKCGRRKLEAMSHLLDKARRERDVCHADDEDTIHYK